MQRKRGFVMPSDGSDNVWEYAECSKIIKCRASMMYLHWSHVQISAVFVLVVE